MYHIPHLSNIHCVPTHLRKLRKLEHSHFFFRVLTLKENEICARFRNYYLHHVLHYYPNDKISKFTLFINS